MSPFTDFPSKVILSPTLCPKAHLPFWLFTVTSIVDIFFPQNEAIQLYRNKAFALSWMLNKSSSYSVNLTKRPARLFSVKIRIFFSYFGISYSGDHRVRY